MEIENIIFEDYYDETCLWSLTFWRIDQRSGNAPGSHGTVGDLNTYILTFLMEYPQNQVPSNEK